MVHGPKDLVLLHLNGRPYDQKPPLYYWLAAAAGAPGGRVTETAARLPSALAGIAAVALTAALGARLFGMRVGLAGAAILLTCHDYAHLSRRIQLDVLLTLLETAALVAFWRLDRGTPRRGRWLAAMHVSMGLAVLTKGPVGFLVPALIIVTFLGWERRWRELRGLFPVWGLALSLGPGLVWISTALALAPKGFAGGAVVDNLAGRFFRGTSHPRPFWYYLLQFPVLGLPWTLLWPLVAWAGWRRVFVPEGDADRRRAWRFLLAWVGASFVFFSLSSGKRGLYLLPALPATALLCADAIELALRDRARWPRWVPRTLAALGALLAAAALVVSFAPVVKHVSIPKSFGVAVAASVVLAAIAWRAAARLEDAADRRLGGIAAVAAGALGIQLAVFVLLFAAFDDEKSPRPIALAAAEGLAPGAPIGLAGSRGLLGGLVYYSGHPVTELRDAAEVERFVATGGRAIVVQGDELARVGDVVPVEVRARIRAGSRAVLVVAPAAREGAAP